MRAVPVEIKWCLFCGEPINRWQPMPAAPGRPERAYLCCENGDCHRVLVATWPLDGGRVQLETGELAEKVTRGWGSDEGERIPVGRLDVRMALGWEPAT